MSEGGGGDAPGGWPARLAGGWLARLAGGLPARLAGGLPARLAGGLPARLAATMRRLALRQEAVLGVILVLALVVLGHLSDRYLTAENLLNQGRLMTEVALIALPMTLVIVTGGIDLSVGSTLGLAAILLGVSWKKLGLPLEAAIGVALLSGAAAGFVNGWFITRMRVPPLIMTLTTLAFYRGLAEGISAAHSVRGYPDWFATLGQGEVAGVPSQLWLLLAMAVFCWVLLARTGFGRSVHAIGYNEVAVRFSAIPADRVKLLVYTLSGLSAGLAAWVFVSRVGTTRSDMGMGVELDAIAAVVMGGASIFGGIGTIPGTVLGVVLIQLLKNGLALTGVKGDATIVVIGAVLIASVLFTNLVQLRGWRAR